MSWKHDVTLLSRQKVGEDELLQPVFEEVATHLACRKRTTTRSEFYQAAQADLKPSLVLEIHSFEYDQQTHLEFEGQRYRVIRTFEKGQDLLELTCERLTEGND